MYDTSHFFSPRTRSKHHAFLLIDTMSSNSAATNTHPVMPRDAAVVLPSPAGNTVAATALPRGAPHTTNHRFHRAFIAEELIPVKDNRVVRKAIIEHIAHQLAIPVDPDKSLSDIMRAVLLKFYQHPVDLTLAPPALLQAARNNYPNSAHILPNPPSASPPDGPANEVPGLDEDAVATLTAGITISDSQLRALRLLTPETIERVFGRPMHSLDDRSTGDSLTINTVDYETVDANTSYPSRAQLIAAANTVNAPTNVPTPAYPPPSPAPDYLITEKDDIIIFPNIDDRKRVSLLSPYRFNPASAPPGSTTLKGFPGQLALYRAFVLHFTDPYLVV